MNKKAKWRSSETMEKALMVFEKVGLPIIIFDTETTGLDPHECRIIQLSALKCTVEPDLSFKEIERLNMYLYPGCLLPEKITNITGITDEMLVGKPTEHEAFSDIKDFFGNKAVVCGHNISFDIGFMKEMYRREGEEWKVCALNTLEMARDLHERSEAGSFKLGDLARYFGLDSDLTFHNSMDDVIATSRLLKLFLEEYAEKKKEMEEGEDEALVKAAPRVKYCSTMRGYRGMQRLYVHLEPTYTKDDTIWFDQVDLKWGEKTPGLLEQLDMEQVQRSVLQYCKCNDLTELKKYRRNQFDMAGKK